MEGRGTVFLRISRFTFDPARYDELMATGADVVGAVRRQPGFQAFYNSVDQAGGRGAAVSLWDTEAHARLDREALGDVIPQLMALGLRFDPAEVYEVIAQA
jgi:hypothetical protein